MDSNQELELIATTYAYALKASASIDILVNQLLSDEQKKEFKTLLIERLSILSNSQPEYLREAIKGACQKLL